MAPTVKKDYSILSTVFSEFFSVTFENRYFLRVPKILPVSSIRK